MDVSEAGPALPGPYPTIHLHSVQRKLLAHPEGMAGDDQQWRDGFYGASQTWGAQSSKLPSLKLREAEYRAWGC